MRRHRTDDYRGRYRMWYWVVPLLLLASVNQTADWGTSLRMVILAAAGIPDYPDATLIWAAVATVLATAVAMRLVIEMRASRLAVASWSRWRGARPASSKPFNSAGSWRETGRFR